MHDRFWPGRNVFGFCVVVEPGCSFAKWTSIVSPICFHFSSFLIYLSLSSCSRVPFIDTPPHMLYGDGAIGRFLKNLSCLSAASERAFVHMYGLWHCISKRLFCNCLAIAHRCSSTFHQKFSPIQKQRLPACPLPESRPQGLSWFPGLCSDQSPFQLSCCSDTAF